MPRVVSAPFIFGLFPSRRFFCAVPIGFDSRGKGCARGPDPTKQTPHTLVGPDPRVGPKPSAPQPRPIRCRVTFAPVVWTPAPHDGLPHSGLPKGRGRNRRGNGRSPFFSLLTGQRGGATTSRLSCGIGFWDQGREPPERTLAPIPSGALHRCWKAALARGWRMCIRAWM